MHRLHKLPFRNNLNSDALLYELNKANINLSELRGIFHVIPNIEILLKLLNVEESVASAHIEDIDSSVNEFYLDNISRLKHSHPSVDVTHCMRATRMGYIEYQKTHNISIDLLSKLQEIISPDNIGIRQLPGLKIYNKITSEVIHTPPQNEDAILDYYRNLEEYINYDLDDYDPLVRLALIHYQFECIHPYKDGNGRLGRLLNVLYLISKNRLQYPVLNLSLYLNETKDDYFHLLTKCHNDIRYLEEFVIYLLRGIKITTSNTINKILDINHLIINTQIELEKDLPTLSNLKINEHIFMFPYTKTDLFKKDLGLARATATKYLKELEEYGYLSSVKIGKEVLYRNNRLFEYYNK